MNKSIKMSVICILMSVLVSHISACSLAFGIFLVQSPSPEPAPVIKAEQTQEKTETSREDAASPPESTRANKAL